MLKYESILNTFRIDSKMHIKLMLKLEPETDKNSISVIYHRLYTQIYF